MNIQQANQLRELATKMNLIESIPEEVNQALKRMDHALQEMSDRIKTIEKQHQAVLDNIQYLKDLVSGRRELPNKHVYEQKKIVNSQ